MRLWWITLSLGMMISSNAAGYCLEKQNGKFVAWEAPTVIYHVSDNLTAGDKLAAIEKAFNTWAGVKCSSLKFQKGTTFKITDLAWGGTYPNKHIYIYSHPLYNLLLYHCCMLLM